MSTNRLIWKLFPSYLFIAFVTILAITAFSTHIFRNHLVQLTYDQLTSSNFYVQKEIEGAQSFSDLALRIDQAATTYQVRVTLFDQAGVAAWDSHIENNGWSAGEEAREVAAALSGKIMDSQRFSAIYHGYHAYHAEPFKTPFFQGVLRTSQSAKNQHEVIRRLYLTIFLAGAGLICLVLLISFAIAKQIGRTLDDFRQGVETFSKGRLKEKVSVQGSVEFEELSDAMNVMAKKLDSRYRMVLEERNQKNAILSSMGEGILTIDHHHRITGFNDASKPFFKAKLTTIVDQHYQEVIRDKKLLDFIEKSLQSDEPVQAIWTFGKKLFIQAHGTTLKSSRGRVMGALIVLSDVTHLKRLESMRKDFVANVSHELKTPMTVISGFIETLLEGGADDPEQAKRFLQKIGDHTQRIQQIIEDLLTLSGLEQSEDTHSIVFTRQPLISVLSAALEMCQLKNKGRNIQFSLNCSETLEASLNADLMEEAVLNLLDNAAKYSESGQSVSLDVEVKKTRIYIHVSDQGCGIPSEDQSRVFERFYRVDKGRSRKVGGTGLGLAIVKHIVTSHSGDVKLKSQVGEGSVFTIVLPRKS